MGALGPYFALLLDMLRQPPSVVASSMPSLLPEVKGHDADVDLAEETEGVRR